MCHCTFQAFRYALCGHTYPPRYASIDELELKSLCEAFLQDDKALLTCQETVEPEIFIIDGTCWSLIAALTCDNKILGTAKIRATSDDALVAQKVIIASKHAYHSSQQQETGGGDKVASVIDPPVDTRINHTVFMKLEMFQMMRAI